MVEKYGLKNNGLNVLGTRISRPTWTIMHVDVLDKICQAVTLSREFIKEDRRDATIPAL